MKFNNKGQVLVMFVILLPVILLLMGVFLEKMYLINEENKLENIIDIACKSNDIGGTIKKNDNNLEVEIKTVDNKTVVIVKKNVKGFMKYYDIKVNKTCKG